MDALQLLKKFRSHRMGLVQTQHQLKFAFMAIIDGIRSLQDDSNSFQNYVPSEELNSVESESDSDDDFYENDDVKIESTRPGTAKRDKRSSLSKKSKIHIENLRKKQLENKVTIESTEPNNNRIVKENSSDTNIDSSDLDKSEEDIPFAANRSDVQTVRINQSRRPVEPLKIPKSDESFNEKANIENENENESKALADQTGANSPRTSEKNQRISDLVKIMREKQKKHEKRSKFMSDLKPYFYGGAILLSGIVVHQLYRTFVTK